MKSKKFAWCVLAAMLFYAFVVPTMESEAYLCYYVKPGGFVGCSGTYAPDCTCFSDDAMTGYQGGGNVGGCAAICAAYGTVNAACGGATVTMATAGTGTGTVSGGGMRLAGSPVTITATPDPGSTFVSWSTSLTTACGGSTSASCTFSMQYCGLTATATFNDTTAPTVALSSAASEPTNVSPFSVTATFSESVTGFALGDIVVGNGSAGSFSGSGATYTFNITPTANGVVTVDVPANVAQDSATNTNTAATTLSRTYDGTAPTVTINQEAAQADPATGSPINFTVVFSESVTGFATGDVTFGGTATGTLTETVSGSGTTYNVAVSGMASAGTVIASIASGKATDAAGNGNTASASTDNTVDFTPPPASVSSINRAVADPTKATSVTFTVTFTESMSGIDIGDFALALTGTATGTIASVSAASGITVTVTVNSVSGNGTLGLNLNDNDSIKNVLNVPLGGAGVDGSFTGQIYTVDNTAPTVVLTSIATDPTGGSPFSVTATFSESVTGFLSGDVSVTNGSVSSFTPVSVTTYTIGVTPLVNGVVTVNVAANAAQDSAGNNSTAATPLTRTYDSTLVPGYSSTPASGSTITVGMATVGSSVSTAWQVSETGNATLNVASHVLGGTNPLDFSVTPATLSIGNGTSPQNLTIQCTPSAVGLRTATLTVNHDAGAAAAYTLECTGATPASGAGVGSTDNTSVTISFTPGSGSSRIVVFYPTAGGAGFTPADGTGYTATAFGTGAVAPSTYVVYDGSGSSFTVTGLTAGTSYSYAVYEYNGSGGTATYLTGSALTGNVSTTGGGTTGVTINRIGNVTGSTVTAYGTATGTGITERGFYWWIPPTAENHFGGSESGLIPEGSYGAGAFSLNITGLKPGNTYHIKVYVKVGGQIITSDEQIFTTSTTGATGKTSPTVITTSCTMNADGTVTAAGQITDVGTSPVNVYGFLYAKHPYPFTGDNGDAALAMWDKVPVYQGISFTGTIRNLAPGKWYLRAYAHNDNPDSDAAQTASLGYGEDCTFTVPGDIIVPTAPGGLTGVAKSPTQIDLAWTDNSTDETGFRIFRDGTELLPSPKAGANVTTFSDTGLTCGKTYTYTVKAMNADGDSAATSAVTVTTPACTVTIPAASSGLTATAKSQTQIDLAWTDNSGNETGFKIFRDGVELLPSPKVVANVTTFSDTGVTCGTTYTYTVKAVNAAGDSAGVTATATTPACASGSPTAPGGLTGVAKSATQVDLSWTDNSNNETGFRIFRNGVELTPSPKVGAGVTTFSDTGVICGTTYTYTVKAVNAAGDSAGVTATATTPACASGAPTAPGGLTATAVSQTQINLLWTDNSSDETGFKLFRNGVLIKTTGANVTTFSDTGLTCGVTYTYIVKATNAAGDSAGVTASATAQACAYIPPYIPPYVAPYVPPFYDTGSPYKYNQVADYLYVSTEVNKSILLALTGSVPDAASMFMLMLTPLTYTVVTQPLHGTLNGTGPYLTYKPNQDFIGTDYFIYRVWDGTAYSSAPVQIIVHQNSHANIGDKYEMDIFCAEYDGEKYGFRMNLTPVAADPSAYYWKGDLSTFGKAYSSGKGCISVGKDLHLNVPTAVYRGTVYQFTLNFIPLQSDPFGFYWKMDLGTLKAH